MQKNVLQIIWMMLLLGFISMVYFLSVLTFLPIIVPVLAAVVFGYFSYRWLKTNIVIEDTTELSKAHIAWSYIILVAGIFIVTNMGYYKEQKYGYWDAWIMWNYHARFLQFPEYAKFLLSKDSFAPHADYPLYVPGNIAFFRRLTGTDNAIVPFTFSYLVTLITPVTIYLALYRKNLPVATLAFFLIITDEMYLNEGLGQYADLPLALLFLCAFICLDLARKQGAMIAVIAALLGCCMWVKNEGVMLSLVFVIFNVKILFGQGRWKYFAGGISFPLMVLVLFKSIAPSTDLINGQSPKTSGYIYNSSRYELIWQHLGDNFNHNFFYIKIGLIIYAVFCFVEKKLPGRNILILLCCIAGYFLVYVMTPLPLEWHLNTSMSRLLLQLMPSFMYVMAFRFSNLKFSLGDKQLQ